MPKNSDYLNTDTALKRKTGRSRPSYSGTELARHDFAAWRPVTVARHFAISHQLGNSFLNELKSV